MLVISGLARFRTCDSNFSFEYTLIPTTENSCSQSLHVAEGENVELDTRLQFGRGGDCQCIEEVTLLRVRKIYFNGPPSFGCDERREYCISNEEFVVSRGSEQPYNFSLVLLSVDVSSSTVYYVEVEVKQPGLGSRRRFWKIFLLNEPGDQSNLKGYRLFGRLCMLYLQLQ